MFSFLSTINLAPNNTFYIQLLIFLAVFIILRKFIFIPYLKLKQLRLSELKRRLEECDKVEAEAEMIAHEYRHRVEQSREISSALIRKDKEEGGKEADELIMSANRLYREEMEKGQDLLNNEIINLRKRFEIERIMLGESIIEKVVG